MTALNYSKNMFSSVAAMAAAVSSCANNTVALGAAVAGPFFVLISIICITDIICGIVIINALLIALIITHCKYGYKSKQQVSV